MKSIAKRKSWERLGMEKRLLVFPANALTRDPGFLILMDIFEGFMATDVWPQMSIKDGNIRDFGLQRSYYA
jgi:hypothetical protein